MKHLLVGFLLLSLSSTAQSESEVLEVLESISSVEQIDGLKEKYPAWSVSMRKTVATEISFDSIRYNAEIGQITNSQYSKGQHKFVYKTLKKGSEEVCRAQYIYLDGSEHSDQEIKTLRKEILDKYENGVPFLELVQEYNEEGNPDGVLIWFYKGMMVEEFDQSVRKHGQGEIFNVDVPKREWYYVVLKTDKNKLVDCSYSICIELGK